MSSPDNKSKFGLPFWSRVGGYGVALAGSIALAEKFVPQDAFSITAFLFLLSILAGEGVGLARDRNTRRSM